MASDPEQQLNLLQLLEKACPKPARLATNGGAILSLSLHCLMVKAGYRLEDGLQGRGNEYQLPPGWDSKFKQEWVFSYTKPGKANRFVLHCSLQELTNRMFVHASEAHNDSNIQILGLQLDNYVPDPQQVASGWAGVLHREDSMIEMVSQYITDPLAAAAEDAPDDDAAPGPAWSELASSSLRSLSTTHYVLAGAAVVVAAALIIYRYRQR